ncbi:hypothetical protein TIFTF001_013438 [Ficus carica]|uniref:Uncharacterized protein n=1 Tax=Ficus carica TaxID=3494 RepID=A0AA88D620_FICCA|nr:hypothetical protein TIFTF001_013438 [Ficus carica]
MGVPSFYRWLLGSFPRAVVDAYKGNNPEETMEFDNLYLDMNGIIHPCFHPEGLPAPRTYDEVFEAVFKYIDAVFSIVKPRKLLFLAIDGVAPRAKMNQQRSRRFRAAREAAEEAAEREELGVNVSETQEEQSGKLDSNVITPGTEFMALLSSALQHYIRLRMNERNLPGYDPNTRHCLYGLDADLIMLALTTHEIHFSILREDIRRPDFFSKNRRDSSRMSKQDAREVFIKKMENYISKLKFQFLHVWILREYLAHAMKIPDRTVKADLERLIDDFVLMCLFVGNDFLPHVPSLEISEGAIDLLMEIYKKEFVRMGGYLTNSFEVNLARMKHILEAVGSHEGGILRKRMQIKRETDVIDQRFSRKRNRNRNKRSVGGELKRSALLDSNTGVDKIKYGEVGWKERYYAEKFEVETEDDRERIRRDVVLKYTEGICWVMHYYYQGVCSWQWFYPYHYAPLASDFHGIENLKIEFTLGQPFKPLDQLMAVLPSASAHALPLFYRKLMTEASSPLLAFYPTDFELDMNGKRFSWQAICKLPFIDESLLLSEIARVEHTLTDEERQRNRLGFDVLFIHISQPFAKKIVTFYKRNIGHPKLAIAKVKRKIDPRFSGGMNGYMFISDKPVLPKQIDSPIDGMQMIANNEVLSVFYGCPPYHEHIPRPPEEVAWPKKCIRKKDIKPKLFLWHEHTAVIGRLHSQMPIHKSIFGSRLAKSARQLVLTYCLEMQQKSRGSVERGEGARAHRVFCYDYYKTIDASVGDTSGDKSCTKGGFDKHLKGKQQKRKCEQNDIELSDRTGQSDKHALKDNIQGGDEPTRQSKLDQTFGDKISIDGVSEKHERERKWKKGNMVPNGHADGLSCHANLEKGICADGTRGEETIAADESRKEAVGVLDNNQVGDELTLQLQMDRTVGDKSSIDGESGAHKKKQRQNEGNAIAAGICGSDIVPNEHEGTDGIRSRLILEKGICADKVQGEKTVVVESSKQAICVPDNNQGREESTFQLQADQTAEGKSTIHEGTDESFSHLNLEEGIRADEDRGEKTMAVESSKQPIGVPDNIVGGVELTISNSMEAVDTTPTETNGNSMDGHVGEDGLACHFNRKEMVLVDESIGDENSRSEKQQREKRKKGELDLNVIKPNDPDNCSFSILDNNIVVKDSTAIQITQTPVCAGVTGGDRSSHCS